MNKFYTFLGIAIFFLSVLGAFFLWRYIPVYVGNNDAGFTATQALFAALGFVGLLGTLILQTISMYYGRKHQEKAIQNSERAIMLNALNVKTALDDSILKTLHQSIKIKHISKKQYSQPVFEDLLSEIERLKTMLDSSGNDIFEKRASQLEALIKAIASNLNNYMKKEGTIDDEIIVFDQIVTDIQIRKLSDQVKIAEMYNLVVADLKGEEALMPEKFKNVMQQIQ